MRRGYLIGAVLAALVLGVPSATAVPATPTITGPSSPANGNAITLVVTTDPGASVSVYVTDDCSGPATATGTADGTGALQLPVTVPDDSSTSFRATATDGTDTSPCSPPFTYVEDSTPPDTTISGTPPALTDATASFAFTGGVGFECKLDDADFAACTSPANYSGLSSGSHTFSVRAHDAAGNVDPTPDSVTWTVDATPPQTTVTSGPLPLTNSRSASIVFGGSDANPVHFQCRLGAAAFADCSSPASYAGLADGAHTFNVRAIDVVGNVDPTPATYTWTVDATPPPSPVLTKAPNDPSSDATPSFEFNDLDLTAGFRCTLDGAAPVDCSSGTFTPTLADGAHTFGVQAVDPAGNTSGVTSYSWTVDTVSPLVTFTEKPPLLTNQTSATFSFSADKPGSTYECALDGGAFSSCTSPKAYVGLGNGSHTVAIRAIRLGLTGPAARYTWTVDLVPPQTTIAAAPPASSTSAAATFAFSGSEQATFTCRLDGGGPAPCTSPKTYTGLGDGAHTFSVQAVDRAGNADPSPATYSWQIAGVGPPAQDLRPPANVARIRHNVGYRVLQLRWSRPRDTDFDHVTVFLSTKKGVAPRKLVYSGKRQSYVDHRFQNGLYYRYLVVSYDTSDNASGGRSTVVPPNALLRSPRNGQAVRSAPLLRWTPVRKATFYNVQLYYRGGKILSAWPRHARQVLKPRWTYSGRAHGLRKGVYSWFVWPGFGPRAKSRYGQLLGLGTFRVR